MSKWWPFPKKVKNSGKRIYAGARLSRLDGDWVMASTSQDTETKTSLRALRDRSRALERDNDYIKGAFREIENNVVGIGIPFQSQVKKQRGSTLDDKTNDLIEKAFTKWANKTRCHTAGTLNFQEIEQLVIHSIARDGDFLVRKIRRRFGDSKIPFALEVIEGDLLDDSYNEDLGGGRDIVMGVERDEWKRPVAYHILAKHPGDYPGSARGKTDRVRIPAEEVIHLYRTDRAHATRGVPWTHSGMTRARHMHGYEEASVVAARGRAAFMGVIETPDGEYTEDEKYGQDDVSSFEPGTIKKLAKGEEFKLANAAGADTQFDPFVRSMLRGLASGIGVSYEALSKDYSQSNYSSSRLALLSDRYNWQKLQAWLITNFHQPIFDAWLDMAVLAGEINLPLYETKPELYQAVKWMPRGWSYIDPQKEISALKEGVRSGFMTLSEAVAQSGGDLDELLAQRKRELDKSKEYGLVFDTDPSVVSGAGQLQQPKDSNEKPKNSAEDTTDQPQE